MHVSSRTCDGHHLLLKQNDNLGLGQNVFLNVMAEVEPERDGKT